ncbi:hypothetical protein [Lysobacter sp. P5_B9]
MENFGRYLTYSLLASLAALPVGCIATGFAFGLWAFFTPPSNAMELWSSLTIGFVVAIAASLTGLVPALVYGAPAYAVLAFYKRNNLVTAALVGALPSAVLWAISSEWVDLFLIFGVPVACTAHLFVRARVRQLAGHGSNNSFKPKPLRGSA